MKKKKETTSISKPPKPPTPPTPPIPLDQQILTIVKDNQQRLIALQHTSDEIHHIVHENHEIVKENRERLIALAQNLGLLTDIVNNFAHCCNDVLAIVKQILAILSPHSLTVIFSNLEGEFMGATLTLTVGQTANATAHEWSGPNGTGVELPLAGAISWVSSDPTIATVDPTSGLVTAVAAGQATITGTDAANGLTGSGIVSDQPVVAVSLTVDLAAN